MAVSRQALETYLAPKPARSIIGGIILLALASTAAVLAFFCWQQFANSKALDEQLGKLQTAQSARTVPAPNLHQLEEAKQWAQVRTEKDFPWEKVFRAIERTTSTDIELLEFHPDKLNRVIILRGEAKSIEGLLAYLHDLTAKTGWSGVHLTHQEKVKHGALETVSFEIKATLANSG